MCVFLKPLNTNLWIIHKKRHQTQGMSMHNRQLEKNHFKSYLYPLCYQQPENLKCQKQHSLTGIKLFSFGIFCANKVTPKELKNLSWHGEAVSWQDLKKLDNWKTKEKKNNVRPKSYLEQLKNIESHALKSRGGNPDMTWRGISDMHLVYQLTYLQFAKAS